MARIAAYFFIFSVLIGCGGSEQGASTQVDEEPISSVTPTQPDIVASPKAVTFNYKRRSDNALVSQDQVVSTQTSNGEGNICAIQSNQNYTGNLILCVENVTDPDGIKRVLYGFSNATDAYELCDGSCQEPFSFLKTGVNPGQFNQTPGNITIQLWIEDFLGNLSSVDSRQIFWDPRNIVVAPLVRTQSSLTINWNSDDESIRYNAYLDEMPLNPFTDIQSSSSLRRQISISDTQHIFDNLSEFKNYHIKITGIDDSGESAFSQPLLSKAATYQAPILLDDAFYGEKGKQIEGNVLVNDDPVDAAPLSVVISEVSQPKNGVLEIQADGTFNYQPNMGFFGTDSFTYQAVNQQGAISQANVTMVLTEVNSAPLVLTNTYSSPLDSELEITQDLNLLNNDLDFDGQPLKTLISSSSNSDASSKVQQRFTAQVVSSSENGEVDLNEDGTFSYTPNTGFDGIDRFSYQVVDPLGVSSTAEAFIHVNDAGIVYPAAVNDQFALAEDSQLRLKDTDILSNDINLDESPTLTIIENVKHGELELATDGTFNYTPDENYFGQDYFVYTVTLASGNSASAFSLLNIQAVNDPPVANDDSISVSSSEENTFFVSGNDQDIDGELALDSIQIVSNPSNGSVRKGVIDGELIYQSERGFIGQDAFTYTISDETGAVSSAALVSLFVTSDNVPPVAVNDSATTTINTPVNIDILANDTDQDGTIDLTTFELVAEAENGDVVFNSDSGDVTYTPTTDFEGSDGFEYKIKDDFGTISNTARVTISVEKENQAPTSEDDTAQIEVSGTTTISVLNNDNDEDGELVVTSVSIVTVPSQGNTIINSDGSITYTHTGTSSGSDSFTYRVKDNDDAFSNTATVTITIVQPNEIPVAASDSTSLFIGETKNIDVLGNDSDSDGNLVASSVVIVTSPIQGTATVNTDGTINYTHTGNTSGSDSFTYRVQDNDDAFSNTATVTITIVQPNELPVAVPDSATLLVGQSKIIDVLDNDTDSDGNLVVASVAIVTAPTQGTATLNTDGTINYNHTGTSSGSDSFTYRVQDNDGAFSNTATVSIEIQTQLEAQDDSFRVLTSSSVIQLDVLSNDQGVYAAPVITIDTQPSQGAVSVNSTDNKLEYQNSNASIGQVTFEYTVSDNNQQSSAEVTLYIAEQTTGPIALGDAFSTRQDTYPATFTIDVLNNDIHDVGTIDTSSIVIVSSPSSGSASVVGNQVSFTATAPGSYSFTYSVNDTDEASSNVATVNVEVNRSLKAFEDKTRVILGQSTNVDVLSNDEGVTSDVIISIIAQPNFGSASVTSDNKIQFQDGGVLLGEDELTYKLSAPDQTSNNAKLTLVIAKQARGPVALDDAQTGNTNSLLTILVLDNDLAEIDNTIDATSVQITEQPDFPAEADVNSDGSISFTSSQSGTYTFKYTVNGSNEETSNAATVRVTVN
jgi:hypothetical protein